ncbi:MarR family winged helix-turn-helix transcriptional regulator [Polycladidibacter hongkongensis]|uniref:MarR family winged helix-turn-helix transcriptional regulator n=1 Tax=Polycladidibacter hongkongensis TaxID=1647556 RepID=UPI00082C64CC|nr:MarR family winged helix-turn-helix transcriptional regulator [Pseudovibrio hongkongensis]
MAVLQLNSVNTHTDRPHETLIFLVQDFARLLRRSIEHELSRAGMSITPSGARVLFYVTNCPGLRQNQLAERMSLDPMTLVGHLDMLEEQGLIERVADPKDRRCNIIVLTDKAVLLTQRVRRLGEVVERNAMGDLGEDEISLFRDKLETMRNNLIDRLG